MAEEKKVGEPGFGVEEKEEKDEPQPLLPLKPSYKNYLHPDRLKKRGLKPRPSEFNAV